jgi:hypothetical protein
MTTSGTVQNINVTNLSVQDPLIVLGSGSTNTSGTDKGLIIDRGVEANAGLIWDESADEFACITTTETGTTAGNVTISGYATIHATATSANYSDLAERYHGPGLEPGDVVNIGGDNEIRKTEANEDDCFGVISTQPAVKMNADAGDDESHPYVALAGRVPCKVEGNVSKGQRLVPGDTPGTAKGADPEDLGMTNVVGRSLEDKGSSGISIIEIVVSRA